MASEDSVENRFARPATLLPTHVRRVSELDDGCQTLRGPMEAGLQQTRDCCEDAVVLAARGVVAVVLQERDDPLEQSWARPDGIHEDVRIALFRINPPDPEVVLDHFEEISPEPVLIHVKLRLDQKAEGRGRVLLDADANASFTLDKAGYEPARRVLARQAFLLIVCTVRIVTAHIVMMRRVPDRYSEFPAFSQIL